MYFLQTGPAETTSYMIAGFVVIFGIMLIYVISLFIRRRNLIMELHALEEESK